MEDGPQILPPPSIDPISRPSSTSTSASASLTQLPGISSLAASNGASNNPPQPQLRATNAPSAPTYTGASPAATSGGAGNNLVSCVIFLSILHFSLQANAHIYCIASHLAEAKRSEACNVAYMAGCSQPGHYPLSATSIHDPVVCHVPAVTRLALIPNEKLFISASGEWGQIFFLLHHESLSRSLSSLSAIYPPASPSQHFSEPPS
jgi:hypothetical protein